jgi:Fic family protein
VPKTLFYAVSTLLELSDRAALLRPVIQLQFEKPTVRMQGMGDYKWKPIAPLSDIDRQIDLSESDSLAKSWIDFRNRIATSNPGSLQEFNERLIRSLSIETGILERIYDLDRGTTEALIAKGFYEELVGRESTNVEPARLIDILQDQHAAILLLQDLIGNSRPLTKGVILELHAVLMRHQETTEAVDQLGRRVEIPLLKGAFKKFPNNPKRPDGNVHEYSPPEHVDTEVEQLLRWLEEYLGQYPPLLVASWLQHRFTQIHPFQDGNGRVSRALVTYVLLRSGLLPLVIDRDRRTEYITALEKADSGDLGVLTDLFSALEKNAILKALSLDQIPHEVHTGSITESVIESLANKRQRQRDQKRLELLRVNEVARALRELTREFVSEKLNQVVLQVFAVEEALRVFVSVGGPDFQNAHWYKYEVTSLNREPKDDFQSPITSEKWINFDEDHYFVKGSIRESDTRLVFVVSLHHIGRELTGVMEASAFATLETFDEANDSDEGHVERVNRHFFPVSVEPFAITWESDIKKIEAAYTRWIDPALGIALKEWGDRL